MSIYSGKLGAAVLALAVLLTFIGIVLVSTRGSDDPLVKYRNHADVDPGLAERVNRACDKTVIDGKLYHGELDDWVTRSEFDHIPKGTVKVTCVEVHPADVYVFKSWTVAVPSYVAPQ